MADDEVVDAAMEVEEGAPAAEVEVQEMSVRTYHPINNYVWLRETENNCWSAEIQINIFCPCLARL